MKKIYLLFVLMIGLSVAVMAQNDYQFKMFTEKYSEINDGKSLTGEDAWDDADMSLELGFPFKLFGNPVGDLYAPGMGSEIYYEAEDEDDENIADYILISPFLADFADTCYDDYALHASCSEVSYVIDGTAGNRIFKMQWSNVGFWNPDFETVNKEYYVNMQLWIYEKDNAVEFRYGPSHVTEEFLQELFLAEEMPHVAVLEYDNVLATVNGDPKDPTFICGSADSLGEAAILKMGLKTFPEANTVYRIAPKGTGVQSYDNIDVVISPNPVGNTMTITGADNALVQIFDINGKLLRSEIYNNPISVSDLSSGLYMVKITTDQGSTVKKIVK